MRISEVLVRLIEEPASRCVAFATIVFDNCFVVRDIRLIKGDKDNPDRMFMIFPRRGTTLCEDCGTVVKEAPHNGRVEDVAHPKDGKTRDQITAVVVEHYKMLLGQAALGRYKYGSYARRLYQANTVTA